MIGERTKAGDVVVCLGAGSITYWAAALPTALAKTQGSTGRGGAS
jgi:UDP-N-acetylmuramate--alanine ligase